MTVENESEVERVTRERRIVVRAHTNWFIENSIELHSAQALKDIAASLVMDRLGYAYSQGYRYSSKTEVEILHDAYAIAEARGDLAPLLRALTPGYEEFENSKYQANEKK